MPPTFALMGAPERVERVFSAEHIRRLEERGTLLPGLLTPADLPARRDEARAVEAIFCTWGMPLLDEATLAEYFPSLKAVFYAAGSVKHFAEPLLARGVTVVSAWAANALPVAEVTLSQILLAGKNYYSILRWSNTPPAQRAVPSREAGHGNYHSEVAIIGAGMIGRRVLDLLRPFDLQPLLVDPFVSTDEARALGAEKVELDEAFRRARVVSNHLPNLPELRPALRRAHFASMPRGATFINTGRGQQVDEADLISVFRERPDLTALLDVTYPEPPVADSPLYTMPNIFLTAHFAGAEGNEVYRMVDFVLAEYDAWREGRPLRYAVSAKMLETMA